jgi:hypothetical protein
MPYIEKYKRLPIDRILKELVLLINSKGDLNYTICELIGQLILNTKISYTQISEWIDTLPDAEAELRRRLLDPYEDLKINENGDVPSFIEIIDKMKG